MTKRMNRSISMAILTFAAFSASGAHAKFVAVLEEVGSNVVEVGSGALDLTDLGAPFGAETISAAIEPDVARINTSSNNPDDANLFSGAIAGPSNFGPGSDSSAPFSVGDPILVSRTEIAVPVGYIFGAPLANSSIYPNATFSSLGVTPGTYVWSWGVGAHADTFTLQITPSSGAPSAPEASTWAMTLIGFAGLGFAALQRKGGVRSTAIRSTSARLGVRREERNGMMKRTAYLASIAALALSAVLGPSAQAKFVITLSEVGPNVVEIGRGTIDVTDLGPPSGTSTQPAIIFPGYGEIAGGSGSPQMDFDTYAGVSNPGIFGVQGWTFANLGTGDPVDASIDTVAVPVGYQSGAPLANSSFFADATFDSLGIVIPGTYVWSWGTGAHADTITLQIGPSVSGPAAPEPSTWAMMLIGFAGLSYTAARRARAHRAVSA